MSTATLFILVKWLILPKPIDITIKTENGDVKYNIKQIKSLEPIHLFKAVTDLKNEISFIKDKKKKIIDAFNKNIKNEFTYKNPCCLIKIENINLPEEHNTNVIPNFLFTIINELTYALSLIYSCPITPLFYIYQVEGIKEIRVYNYHDGINTKNYENYFKERNIKELTEKYLPNLMLGQRGNYRLTISLILYKITLEMRANRLRVIFFWTILETLAGGSGLDKVHKFLSKYTTINKKDLMQYYEARNMLIHSGRLKENYKYDKSNKELMKLIQEVIFAVYGKIVQNDQKI